MKEKQTITVEAVKEIKDKLMQLNENIQSDNYGLLDTSNRITEIIQLLNTFQDAKLPSDEEIETWIKSHGYYGTGAREYYEGLREGANYVINYLKGGKE